MLVGIVRGPSSRMRQKLIAAVRAQWITGVLDRSLERMARVEVGLSARPDAVEHPWGALVALPSGDVRTLPAGTALLDVYDECQTGLLILGEPGAGKTTALLELARDLLCRAERDPKLPVPVVFHLSSWAAEHTSLAEWLGAELTRRYGVSRGLARDWLRTEAVLPLLDGLDEVDQTRREACVAAINAWRDEHGMLAAVVCSRTADYERLAERLRLASAVVLRPLSRPAVAGYLRAAGRSMAGVRTVLARDERLWELLTTPLMLSIVVLAYARVPATHIRADGDIETRRSRLLTDYVDAMLARPRSGLARDRPCHQPVETRRWLSWLAEAMSRRHESVFYPDWLQISSLPDRKDRVRAVVQPALLVGITTAVVSQGINLTTGNQWYSALLFGVVAALACGRTRIRPVRAWQRRAVAELMPTTPGEAMTRTRGQAIDAGVGVAVLVAVVWYLGFDRLWPPSGLTVQVSLFAGWLTAISTGLADYLRHRTVLRLLARRGHVPKDLLGFLDYADSHILLRRTGGGYTFVHRLVLEYFATSPAARSIGPVARASAPQGIP